METAGHFSALVFVVVFIWNLEQIGNYIIYRFVFFVLD